MSRYKARNIEEPPATSTVASRFYAVKVIKKPSGEEERRRPMITSISTLREAKLLRELSHPQAFHLASLGAPARVQHFHYECSISTKSAAFPLRVRHFYLDCFLPSSACHVRS